MKDIGKFRLSFDMIMNHKMLMSCSNGSNWVITVNPRRARFNIISARISDDYKIIGHIYTNWLQFIYGLSHRLKIEFRDKQYQFKVCLWGNDKASIQLSVNRELLVKDRELHLDNPFTLHTIQGEVLIEVQDDFKSGDFTATIDREEELDIAGVSILGLWLIQRYGSSVDSSPSPVTV